MRVVPFLIPVLCLSLLGCAVQPSHSAFQIEGETPDTPFATSQELRTAGLVSEGMILANNGRFADSAARFRQALYLDPQNSRIQLNLALALQQADETDESVQLFDRLYRQNPRNPDVLVGYGNALVSARKVEEGKRYLKEAFTLFSGAGNTAQAALVARSISNVAFGAGEEQEALCYSYEAWTLSPNAEQLGAHTTLMVGLNLYREALLSSGEAIKETRRLARSSHVQYARALAFYGLGKFQEAVDASDLAKQFLAQSPELASQVSAVRWLATARLDRSGDSDIEVERFEDERQEVQDYALRAGYETIFWPPALVDALEALAASRS